MPKKRSKEGRRERKGGKRDKKEAKKKRETDLNLIEDSIG